MLPLAEEVREARAEVDEALHAVTLTAGLHLVRFELAERAGQSQPRGDAELPGDAFVADCRARWGLAVPSLPPPEAPMSAHVAARQAQIQLLEAFVQPIADAYLQRTVVLGSLVHDQYHLMEDPMFEDAIAEIVAWEAERTALATDILPVEARQTGIPPLIGALGAYIPVVETALASNDPVFWRACAEAARDGIVFLSASLDIPLAAPTPIEDPREDLVILHAWLSVQHDALVAESAQNQSAMRGIADRYAAITARMQENTG